MSKFVSLGERLEMLREEQNLTKNQIAKKIDISRVTYDNYITGRRTPDCSVIIAFCREFKVSADYLLGLSQTRNPSYAKIAETTGLTETAIEHMGIATPSEKAIINFLLEEEPRTYTMRQKLENIEAILKILLPKTSSTSSYYLDPIELEMKEIPDSVGILEFVKEDWLVSEYFYGLNSEGLHPWIQREAEATQEDLRAVLDFIPKEFDVEAELSTYEQHKKAESLKSNLISRIVEYVEYQSGCALCARGHQEDLSPEHTLHIGIGDSRVIHFPSAQSDELFEFMLTQKIIDALKIFKKNYWSNKG